MKTIVIRVDANREIGYGHLTRCLALAASWHRYSVSIYFLSDRFDSHTIDRITGKGFEVRPLSFLDGARFFDLLIVDHYQLSASWEKSVSHLFSKILVIDDLANRNHDCHFLLDGAFGRLPSDYVDLVPQHAHYFVGASYVLLSSEYAHQRVESVERRKQRKKASRLLISMGGSDPKLSTLKVLSELSQIDASIEVEVVASSQWSHLSEIRKQIDQLPHSVRLHLDLNTLAAVMSSADLAIIAGGMTAYECCCMGLPMVIINIAENQRYNARILDRQGAACYLGSIESLTAGQLSEALNAIVGDSERWSEMAAAAVPLCDGYGANRVVETLLSEDQAVRLRPATLEDADVIFQWQQDPTTRQFSRNTTVPTYDEHIQFMKKSIQAADCFFNVIVFNDVLAGVLRLNRLSNRVDTFEVSVFLGSEYRSKGIASKALNLARKIFPNLQFYAEVHEENIASQQLFLNNGYFLQDGAYINRSNKGICYAD